MNVYAETNFILEMAFLQEEYESCETILSLAREHKINLVVPAFSIVEPYEAWVRRRNKRSDIQSQLAKEMREITRSASYRGIGSQSNEYASLLVRSVDEDKQRLDETLVKVLEVSDIIPIELGAVKSAIDYQVNLDLPPQDSIVYASVMEHLRSGENGPKCFLNRNSKDFLNPDIQDELKNYGCRLISRFADGLGFIKANLT